MKWLILIVLTVLQAVSLYSQERWMSIGDGLRVRSAPTIDGEIIESLVFGDGIRVFGFNGSGEILNGLWDYWASVNESQTEWVNVYWIARLPIYFFVSGQDESGSYAIPAKIEGVAVGEDGRYFDAILRVNRRLQFYDSEPQRYLQSDLNLSRGAARSNTFAALLTDSPDMQAIYTESNRRTSPDGLHAYYESEGVTITEALYYNTPLTIRVVINNPNVVLFYGITVGISRENLVEILGPPSEQTENRLTYRVGPTGGHNVFEFEVDDGQVTTIVWEPQF